MARFVSGNLEIIDRAGRWMLRSRSCNPACLTFADGRSLLVSFGMPAIIGLSNGPLPPLFPAVRTSSIREYRKGDKRMSVARYQSLRARFLKTASLCTLTKERLDVLGYRAVPLPRASIEQTYALFEDVEAAMAFRTLLSWDPVRVENFMRGVTPMEFEPVGQDAGSMSGAAATS